MRVMRRLADAGRPDGFDAFARGLQSTFPARGDAPLAVALLRLLAAGRPVTAAALARAVDHTDADVVARLSIWPNIERDEAGGIVGFAGLTLRPTLHGFTVGNRQLHTWCAWDTLFLPALLNETADVRSACPVSGSAVELVVAPDCVTSARPADLHVSFPPLAATDTADITGSFCCHVFFLAGTAAARTWRETRTDDTVVDVDAAFELGRRAMAPLLDPVSSTLMEVRR